MEGLNFYVCTLLQPLDDCWGDSPGCLHGEGDWTSYRIPWGVLAADEAEAGRVALAWQSRGYPLEPVVEDVAHQGRRLYRPPGRRLAGTPLTLTD